MVHEIGKPDDKTVELILSADGMRDNIAGVLALMAGAPKLDGFLFTAFRPRRPAPGLEVLGRRITTDDLKYVSEAGDDGRLDVEIFLPGDWSDRERAMIGFLMLDQAIGEYDVMTGLGAIVFAAVAPPEARPLTGLPAEFDAFKAATAH